MALALGTNCGFVSSVPAGDPAGVIRYRNDQCFAIKDTSPSGSYSVDEIGWYQSRSDNDAIDYSVGIYSHDAVNDRPNALLATQTTGGSIGANTEGWDAISGLSISLTTATVYWVAIGADSTKQFAFDVSPEGEGQDSEQAMSAAPNYLGSPWSETLADIRNISVYAHYVAAGGALPIPRPLSRPFSGPLGGM